jgi:hypothetical protein
MDFVAARHAVEEFEFDEFLDVDHRPFHASGKGSNNVIRDEAIC